MRKRALTRTVLLKDRLKWLINACATKIVVEIFNLRNRKLQVLIRVIYTSLCKQEFVLRPVAAHIEFATYRKTLKEKHEGLTSKRYRAMHRTTAVDQKYVLFTTCIFIIQFRCLVKLQLRVFIF